MPRVSVLGVKDKMDFPDDMSPEAIREFLRRKFSQERMSFTNPDLTPQPQRIEAYEPSLREKMSSGISSALQKSGLISDNYRANKTGENLTQLAEFIPGVGDAVDANDFGVAAASGDIGGMAMAGLGIVPVVGDVAQKIGKKIKSYKGDYPLDDFDLWWGDRTYKEQGAEMFEMSPDEYLAQVKPLKMDDETLENVDDLVDHMQSGRKLDPLVIYADGKEDGRHRALAAKKLGFNTVPVIDYRKPELATLKPDLPMDKAPKQVSKNNDYLYELEPEALNLTETQFKDVSDYKGDPLKPIAVTKKDGDFYILDGHHRAKIAKESGQKVKAVVIPEKDFKELDKKGIHQGDMLKEWIASGKLDKRQ